MCFKVTNEPKEDREAFPDKHEVKISGPSQPCDTYGEEVPGGGT